MREPSSCGIRRAEGETGAGRGALVWNYILQPSARPQGVPVAPQSTCHALHMGVHIVDSPTTRVEGPKPEPRFSQIPQSQFRSLVVVSLKNLARESSLLHTGHICPKISRRRIANITHYPVLLYPSYPHPKPQLYTSLPPCPPLGYSISQQFPLSPTRVYFIAPLHHPLLSLPCAMVPTVLCAHCVMCPHCVMCARLLSYSA